MLSRAKERRRVKLGCGIWLGWRYQVWRSDVNPTQVARKEQDNPDGADKSGGSQDILPSVQHGAS
jgi:hypothetical protein